MKKDSRKRLMEMMEKVNPDSINSTPTEKEIIDDILSLDEGVGDILSKMKEYARKGLLTATVILSVASAVAAGNVGGNLSADDVVKAGTEMVDDEEDKKMYGFYAALASEFSSEAKRNGNIEASNAFGNIAEYFVEMKEGRNPEPLKKETHKYMKYIYEQMKELNSQQIQSYIAKGLGMKYKPAR